MRNSIQREELRRLRREFHERRKDLRRQGREMKRLGTRGQPEESRAAILEAAARIEQLATV